MPSKINLVNKTEGLINPATEDKQDIANTSLASVVNGKTIKSVTGSTSSTATVIAAVADKRIKVIAYSLIMVSASALTVTFKSGANGTALWTIPLQALTGSISGVNLAVPSPSFLFGTAAGALLELAVSAAVSVTFNLTYFTDDSV